MSTWMKNLKMAIERKEVIILHGNVRDKYISADKEIIYNNLTELLQDVCSDLPIKFSRSVFYDVIDRERRSGTAEKQPPLSKGGELSSTAPSSGEEKTTPTRVLAGWARDLNAAKENTLAVIFYLDKLVPYKQGGYIQDEREILLRLEKLIENITPNNRLVMVALQDTMVPLELYTNSPKVAVIPVVAPDKADRQAYLKHRLGSKYSHLDMVADSTDGLFLRDIDNILSSLDANKDLGSREIRRLINRYRIGEQQDYWGTLDIEKLDSAFQWFTEAEGVKGQDEAVKKVIDIMTLARAGLSGMASGTLSKPKGILFFAGPTGVGKTYIAKKLAKFLFGSEEAFIRFDMSEYKEEHTDSKLIGSPPGYVGYERGGILTTTVREKPFSVVLFDEIEKAHPKIMDIFLQILDEGRLTDSRGQTTFFTETVIIFTSNIGTRTKNSMGQTIPEREEIDAILTDAKLSESERHEAIHRHFSDAVRDFFMYEISRPELLNRIGDNIVPFNYIDDSDMQKKIIVSHLARIKDEFEDRFKTSSYQVEFSPSVVDYLADKYKEIIASFGGRAITNAIENEIMKPLSKNLLKAEYKTAHDVIFKVKAEKGRITASN